MAAGQRDRGEVRASHALQRAGGGNGLGIGQGLARLAREPLARLPEPPGLVLMWLGPLASVAWSG